MKYSVSMSSKSKKKKSVKRKSKYSGISKFDRFKKVNGRTPKTKSSSKKSFLGIDQIKMKKIIYISVGVVFFIGCIGALALGIYLKDLRDSLPSPDQLVERQSDQSTQIFDRDGELLYTIYGDQNREFVPIEDIPEHTKWALLAAEDIEFYQHKGLDYAGIFMAVIQNFTAGDIVRGASTLSQQLVKNTLLADILGEEAFDQKYSRKIKEILITMQVEQKLSKDEILQMYMNEIPFGSVVYGYQAASKAHFAKDVSDLTLAESALLAGIIRNASLYSPVYGVQPERAKELQENVLDLMLKYDDLTGVTEEEVEAAKAEELVYSSAKIDIKAPHFVFYIKQMLEDEYGVDRVAKGGLKVTTSLDYAIQEIAEEEVVKGVANGGRYNVHNGSLVAIDPNNGDVIAMVGSVDYWNQDDPRVDGNVNISTSLRQMGSSAKPYTYLTAILQGYGPWLLTPDIPLTFGGNYKPDNWDDKFMGLMTARKALGLSRNLPAVYTLQLAGIENLINVVEKLGITTLTDKSAYGLSLALGSGEMKLLEHVSAFGVFANEGVKVETDPLLKVETSDGEVLYEKTDIVSQRVFDEKEIYTLNYMLCDLGGHGDRSGASYRVQGSKVCFKTGTTNGPKDLLTVMYHQNLVVGVWAGNNNNEEMPGGWSSNVPLPLAHSFMQRVADQYPVKLYTRPSGVLSTTVCTDTGKVPQDGSSCNTEATIYIQGHAPSTDEREVLNICKENGLIAENANVAVGYDLLEEYIFINNKIENAYHQNKYDEYLLGIEGTKYLVEKPNTGVCPLPLGPDNAPVITISTPTANQQVKRNSTLTITGSVRKLESINEFVVSIDGNPISGASLNADGTYSIAYVVGNTVSIGSHTLTVYAKDNFGKSDTENVNFQVISAGNQVTLDSPANGVTISFPVTLTATVDGTASSVQFFITKDGGTYSTTLGATQSGGTWSATWSNTTAGNGDYTIKARAIISGSAYDSASVTVTY